MGALRVVDVIDRASVVLKDENVRWKRVELQNWLNEAYLNIALLRPDATATVATFTCASGPRQVITTMDPAALRLLTVVRNVAATSQGRVVRAVKRSVLDDQVPDWPNHPASVDAQFYMFDPLRPKEFMVYPPATNATQLEVVYSAAPGAHTLSAAELNPAHQTATTLLLDDVYFTPIVDWVLYRAFSKDSESSANAARAQAYYQAFMTAVGSKTASDVAVSPSPDKEA